MRYQLKLITHGITRSYYFTILQANQYPLSLCGLHLLQIITVLITQITDDKLKRSKTVSQSHTNFLLQK